MSYSNTVAKGLIWSGFEKLSVQIIQFVIGLVLARLLTPSEYGIIGILLVFIAFLQVFIDAGFSKAIIQKKDRTTEDYSTVFYFNGIISIVSYLLLWFTAPLIAKFYDNIQLVEYIRVIGLTLFFNALIAIPTTMLTIDLNFKVLAKVNALGNLLSGLIAIMMAYYGFGVWALVWQQVIRAVLLAILIWLFVRWKPQYVFSTSSLKSLFSFGSKLLYSSLISMVVNNFTNLFIAKLSSTKDLGYYTRGTQFTVVVYGTASSVLESVLLPVFASIQDNLEKIEEHFKTIIKSVYLLIFPIFMLLAILAKPLVLFLLTEKWLPVVPIMQVFCFARMITIISGINVTVLYAIGRSDLVLRQQVFKILIRVIFLVIALPFGIFYIALAELLSTIVHFFINTYYPGKIMKLNSRQQIKQLVPVSITGVGMMIVSYGVTLIVPAQYLLVKLIAASMMGILSYYLLLRLFKIKELTLLTTKMKEMVIR